jgi:type IV pilus assembly protein PilW
MRKSRRYLRTGIGLVDLLVGIAISMLAILVILQIAILFESRRGVTVGGSDAQINGIQVIAAIERDLRMAGYGLGPPELLGCKIKRHYINALPDMALQPVTITNGVDGAPDSLRVLASSKLENSAPARLIAAHPAGETTLLLNSTLAISLRDLMVLQEVGKDCTMFQVTALPSVDYRVQHTGENSPWNPDSPTTLFPASGYGTGAVAINLGAVSDHIYGIDSKLKLQMSRYLSVDNTWQSSALAANIINLQAQYGFDTRPGTQAIPQVNWWSASMIDADGNGVTGDNGDLVRLIAVRLAVVARSAQPEPPAANGCDVSTAPTWLAGDAKNGQLIETAIDVNTNTAWRCFRYRVFQTVIPMRNMIWRQS